MGKKYNRELKKKGYPPRSVVTKLHQNFKRCCTKLNVSHDDYIRTTETRHKKVVSHILQTLYEKGEIYQTEYQGFYSTRAEQFLQEKDKVDGKWPEIFGEVTEITESNYFFQIK